MSHYGSEHFCPLSVIRVFGITLFEEVERLDNDATGVRPLSEVTLDDDMDRLDSALNEELGGKEASGNLFGTVRDAAVNLVRKAASVLGK